MEGQIITPNQKEIRVKGKMYYQADDHAWNVLRIKKEVLNEFKPLKERMSKFSYQMLFYSEWAQFEKSLKKLKLEGLPPPVSIWFVKEKQVC